jgi:hypothetical protein
MSTTVDVTRTCQQQPEPFTAAGLVGALEACWEAIRSRHSQVPAAVIVVGSGSPAKPNGSMKWGHFASLRWQHGTTRLPEVLVSGEGLSRTPAEVLTTLLHEAAHGLSDARGVKDTSRQGRWHNKHFATHAAELGLAPSKDRRLGYSPCTLQPDTTTAYADQLQQLTTALQAYRHPEPTGAAKQRASSNNGVACGCACPRRIRVAQTVLDAGPITCDVCQSLFLPDDADREKLTMLARHYDPTGDHHAGLPTYPWRLAPTGLATVRQLRAAGLRPGGQEVVAQILWRKGKRVAYLYRVDAAKPKRSATTAQQAAIAKALTARRTCPTCRTVRPYYIPRRYGECLDCAPAVAA